MSFIRILSQTLSVALIWALSTSGVSAKSDTQVTAFMQAVAEAASADKDIAAYYRSVDFQPLWTGKGREFRERRSALFDALERAGEHGLVPAHYDIAGLKADIRSARTKRDLGLVEVKISETFLDYARDVQTGILIPSRIDDGLVRKVPYRDREAYLANFEQSDPEKFIKTLAPNTPEYTRLRKEKLLLERQIARGGWGAPIRAKKLEPGDAGGAVVQLRDRLIRMGYLSRRVSTKFDADLQTAVQNFQAAHGLTADGVAGQSTIAELNIPAQERLKSIMVSMERERWTNMPKGDRHVMVNLTDFSAKIIDDGKVTFESRTVVGHRDTDRRSPEFSDTMEHLVINPTWNVPRSIATKEYLPMLKANPNAVSHLTLYDARGQVVNRGAVNFSQYSAKTFPFDIKQAPSNTNALGLVKFMFPNRHNIYLHDTPAKSLFSREVRAYSHGCIRLHKPFEFAYTILAKQSADPKGLFHSTLDTGRETQIDLVKQIPVHIMYRTAFTEAKGPMQYRRDIYGRDAKIWRALANEGVALPAVRG
ncbi:murein L,D-transpeptidase [Cognatishimia sp.]|uniref:L,D-transpeptidase family protein n=1 Tax=Cognatishimia sp. TaxID=2211648 RepID=UPI0035115BF0